MAHQTRNINRSKFSAIDDDSKKNYLKRVFHDTVVNFGETTSDSTLFVNDSVISSNDTDYFGGKLSSGEDNTRISSRLCNSTKTNSLLFNGKRVSGRKLSCRKSIIKEPANKLISQNDHFMAMTETIIEEKEELKEKGSYLTKDKCDSIKPLNWEPLAESTRIASRMIDTFSFSTNYVSDLSYRSLFVIKEDDNEMLSETDETKAIDYSAKPEQDFSREHANGKSYIIDTKSHVEDETYNYTINSSNGTFNPDNIYEIIKTIYIDFKEKERASGCSCDTLNMEHFKLMIKMALKDYCEVCLKK